MAHRQHDGKKHVFPRVWMQLPHTNLRNGGVEAGDLEIGVGRRRTVSLHGNKPWRRNLMGVLQRKKERLLHNIAVPEMSQLIQTCTYRHYTQKQQNNQYSTLTAPSTGQNALQNSNKPEGWILSVFSLLTPHRHQTQTVVIHRLTVISPLDNGTQSFLYL